MPRTRRRARGNSTSDISRNRKREVVEALLAASKAGDFEAVLAVLDPDVVFRSDARAIRMHSPTELRDAAAVVEAFKGRAEAAAAGLLGGEVGILVPVKGRMLLALELAFRGRKVTAVNAVADRETLASMVLEEFGTGSRAG